MGLIQSMEGQKNKTLRFLKEEGIPSQGLGFQPAGSTEILDLPAPTIMWANLLKSIFFFIYRMIHI